MEGLQETNGRSHNYCFSLLLVGESWVTGVVEFSGTVGSIVIGRRLFHVETTLAVVGSEMD